MLEQRLDLFLAPGIPAEKPLPQNLALRPAVADLDDEALIAAIPAANLGDCIALGRSCTTTTGSGYSCL
ncbi:MAG TPA: hypothetical protein VF014_07105 [Casimicrobiaceae bacterium]|nr:hypothetical protein [Casimicrobiaceae bacterium]